ncbi:MAG TPA: endo-1,4-beta-xylanase [Acidobacteriaceae bacterium]|nr:endo-1,4-beta-xylanase [Acidobacteriaceae bacterium]
MPRPTRRQFLAQTAATASLATLPIRSLAQQASPDTLKSAARIPVGCCVHAATLKQDAAYTALVKQQMSILVAENEFKFGPIHPQPTTFFFDDADYIAHFAESNNMLLRGHNFVWHRALPPWFATYVTPANAEQVLVNHIETVAGRYKGRIHSWDVVNEAIQVSDNLPNGMRNSPWQKVLPNYIDIAFRTARRVDPHALLTYNDYGIEAEDEASTKKRASVLALVRGMQQRGVPIDAVGIQSHISAGVAVPEIPRPAQQQTTPLPTYLSDYGPGLKQFMADIQSLGLKIMLTEMDVNDRALPADIPTRDKIVGDVYAHYLNLTLANPAVIALLTWGITDKYTWLNHEGARKDGLPERCLPFDADLKPTPAFYAELNALRGGPKR